MKNSKSAVPYSTSELHRVGRVRTFTGQALAQIAFPLGGIGTGTISLGGRGNLRDWEIYNRPAKGKDLPRTSFAIWARAEGHQPAAKILERRWLPPYAAGGGLPPAHLAGVARMDEAIFRGEYPFAWLDFRDEALPVNVSLQAFNPLIPLNVEDSSIPVAIFLFTVTNPSEKLAEVSVAATMTNPIGFQLQKPDAVGEGQHLNEDRCDGTLRGLWFTCSKFGRENPNYGTAALTTTWPDVEVLPYWYRGGWWDGAHLFWDDFAEDGRLRPRELGSPTGQANPGSILLRAAVPAGKSVALPVFLTWHFPHMVGGWAQCQVDTYVKKQFLDAWHAARYTADNLSRLYAETKQWHSSVFNSTLPDYVIDAITSQASILRTPTCLRLRDGSFFAFEGCGDEQGCCQGNCTHVWNYEQALAFLFPSLERSMRRTDFLRNVWANGMMTFRTSLPAGATLSDSFHPCGDGQMGNIVQAYRDWQLSGDDQFLREIWPDVKRALEYAWTEPNGWDPNKDGVMEGVQHNTYDIEFYGPNTMMGALYLGALRAAEEMAKYIGETEKAAEYREVFQKGAARTEAELWNGEYYIQKVEVMPGVEVPERLRSPGSPSECGCSCDCTSVEWTPDLCEVGAVPKYQYGDGCLSDQLLGQWACHVAGLGHILDPKRVRKTVESIFWHNWRRPIGDFSNVQRVYALNDEAGLLLCSWPKGNRPALPFVYCDEVWTGIEYQVAAHLIYEGLVDEGLSIVKGVRDRHDGIRRNPWNEFECGHHYARAMSSWSILLALSGYRYSGVEQSVAFAPRFSPRRFRTFWSTGSAWGTFTQRVSANVLTVTLQVERGQQQLRSLGLRWPGARAPKKLTSTVTIGRRTINSRLEWAEQRMTVALSGGLLLQAGETLTVVLK